jgi:choline dehydrogenase-like flavoprotein
VTGPSVLIVGSGPTGATYARRLVELLPDVSVLLVEGGPVVTDPPGMNVKNIPDPQLQAAARVGSQGRTAQAGVSGIPGAMVVEGTITARQGTHLIGHAADGSPGMPAAAVSSCVGGQGVHWTCATPRPLGSERISFIPEEEWEEHIAEAEQLLHVSTRGFGDSPQSRAIFELTKAEFERDGIPIGPLPMSADPGPDGALRWGGTDLVLGPLTSADAADRFTLRPKTLCVRLLRDGNRVVGGVLRDVETGEEEEVRADAVVVAADAFRTPQLLWASGIRPDALGRYLTEHPLLFGVISVRDGALPRQEGTPTADPIRGVISIGFDDEVHPFHAQLMFAPVSPARLPEGSPHVGNPSGYISLGWGIRKWPRADDRLTFDTDQLDGNGLPNIGIAYSLTDREEAEVERARQFQARAAAALGEFLPGMPVLMPAGSSLHYMGTVRMGPTDDGTSVCDSYSRVWDVPGLVLAGNGLIPTANACNPTLTSVALAVRGVRALATDLATTH